MPTATESHVRSAQADLALIPAGDSLRRVSSFVSFSKRGAAEGQATSDKPASLQHGPKCWALEWRGSGE
jgi:hypothetical protein